MYKLQIAKLHTSLKDLLKKIELSVPNNEKDEIYVYLLSNGLTLITYYKFIPEYSDFYQARDSLIFAGTKNEVKEQIKNYIYDIEYYS